ncbi:TadE-like protein [Terriglobus roseus DSM 18391]|uniref:TadE-like protein n=1 Tax=Terriglobus roseus (strain DSM 18391 / NRRL B-41598 / KBS 63) TaxID=926566 RepID=I3ZLH4_TERRK|nr:TadE/TadG family type IV pilus assembly protein [Terriglobus roseus]AFL90092.1 TadE-like protein [Terriglobus roseus DSM 18391]
MQRHSVAHLLREDCGSSVLEAALVMPALILVLIAAIDFGRAYVVGIQLASATHAAALYGSQTPTDLTGIASAVTLNAAGISGISTTATFGCECSDGSSAVASCAVGPLCTYNVLNYVDVVATTTYRPLLRYPGIPATIAMRSEARIRSAQ